MPYVLTFYLALSGNLLGILSDVYSGILSGILSGVSSGRGALHSIRSWRYGVCDMVFGSSWQKEEAEEKEEKEEALQLR